MSPLLSRPSSTLASSVGGTRRDPGGPPVGGGGPGAQAGDIFVTAVSQGAGDGIDWDNAFGFSQLGDAIQACLPGGTVHLLYTDIYTGLTGLSLDESHTAHLSEGNEVTIQRSDVDGAFMPIIDPTTVYPSIATTLAGWDDHDVLKAAMSVEDTFGNGVSTGILTGTRTPDPRTTEEQFRTPIDAAAWAMGPAMFRMKNLAHLRFRGIGFKDVGNGCFFIGGHVDNVWWTDCAARNVYRYVETKRGGDLVRGEYWTNGKDIRSDVRGTERGYRILNQSDNIEVRDLYMDSRYQVGDPFANNFAIGDSSNSFYQLGSDPPGAKNITIHGVDRMSVICRAFHWREGNGYRNGDGISSERQNQLIHLENLLLASHTDGGVDLKSSNTDMVNVIAYDNKRNYRLWTTNTWTGPVYSFATRHRGGTGGSMAIGAFSDGAQTFEDVQILQYGTPLSTADGVGSSINVLGGTIRRSSSATSNGPNVTVGAGVTNTQIPGVPIVPIEVFNLQGSGLTDTAIALTFDHEADTYTATWDVEANGNVTTGHTGAANVTVGGLSPGTTYTLRIRGRNANGDVGEWSLSTQATTLPEASSSFVDDFSTNRLATDYDYFGTVSSQWQFVGNGTVRGASGGNANRFMSPLANLTADHKITATVAGYDATNWFGVMARCSAGNGVMFYYNTSGQLQLYRQGGAGAVRTKAFTPPALPFTVGIQAVGDVFTCYVNDVPFDWAADGQPAETSVTVTGYASARVALVGFDDDVFYSDITAVAVS